MNKVKSENKMNTKIVYALVSSESDYYTEQFFISAYSVKKNNPDSHITLLVDDKTAIYLKKTHPKALIYVDEFISEKFPPEMTNKKRSRYLKTTFRNLISGDLLFIDTDTVITGSLQEIDETQAEIAAVYDMHVSLKEHTSYNEIVLKSKKLNYAVKETDEYFNSGVMYVKDTTSTRAFFKQWHENYKEGNKVGLTTDQQPLLKTNSLYNLIKKLDDKWNCQVVCNIANVNDAKIIHYFYTGLHKGNYIPPYKFMSPFFCQRIRDDDFEISESIKNFVQHSKTAFNTPVKIFSGKDLEVVNSQLFFLLTELFYNYNSLFNRIEDAIRWFRIHFR